MESVIIERKVEYMFLYEIDNQCEFALMALEDLKQALKTCVALRIWYSIHAFLTATGNISKLLWRSEGDPKRYLKRKDKLRESLSIGDNSPLKDRKLRNYLEHFDKELQAWVETTTNSNYVDLSFGSLDKVKKIHPYHDLKNFLRYFDDKKIVLVFRGDLAELYHIINAINELRKKTKEKIEDLEKQTKRGELD